MSKRKMEVIFDGPKSKIMNFGKGFKNDNNFTIGGKYDVDKLQNVPTKLLFSLQKLIIPDLKLRTHNIYIPHLRT